jgi:magnesium-transporting ATPase (P-type)
LAVVCAVVLGFSKPDRDVMQRPARSMWERIVNGWLFFRWGAVCISGVIECILEACLSAVCGRNQRIEGDVRQVGHVVLSK